MVKNDGTLKKIILAKFSNAFENESPLVSHYNTFGPWTTNMLWYAGGAEGTVWDLSAIGGREEPLTGGKKVEISVWLLSGESVVSNCKHIYICKTKRF